MKLVGSVTVETPQGDKMVPFTKSVVGLSNNALRHNAALALNDALRTTTDNGAHKLRALSLHVEA